MVQYKLGRHKWVVYLIIVLAMIFWGMSYVWTKIVYEYYQPLTTVFLRLSIASIIMIAILLVAKVSLKIERKHYGAMFLLAFFEPFLYFLGESFGLKYVRSTTASIIIATIPVFTPFAAYFIVKEKITLINYMGILLSFIGIFIMIIEPDMSFGDPLNGLALMGLAVVSAVFYTSMIKLVSANYKPVVIITYQNIIGVILFLPLFLYFEFDNFISVKPNFHLISNLIQLVIFASILAFLFFITAIDKLGVSKVNVFANFIPVVTVVGSYILLPDEDLNFKMIAGMLVVLAGIFIANTRIFHRKV